MAGGMGRGGWGNQLTTTGLALQIIITHPRVRNAVIAILTYNVTKAGRADSVGTFRMKGNETSSAIPVKLQRAGPAAPARILLIYCLHSSADVSEFLLF